ncbi:4-hydroxy-tetrahydrodipicolinate synthase [Paenibacillus sp. GCM10012307]|uniref:4-hydroxy-tetrahydrodipicolinate synthase n=1 Tax=Paenibacillus roseus TaxID=2798579 RepID=A0A934J527_9BACL|nr:4-hydroxy-tetrahydrodipicolinate synthase [Paenibacillus roseus]MBJ6363434.1 4-hydroxy-tetrahydrodipicolinate synthase [Paenibacillus roseus]
MDFGRLVTAMVTPFDTKGQIDWEATGRLIDYLIDEQQNDGIVLAGTTGESPTLSDEEKLELFRFGVQRAAGRCKIIAGTGSNNTADSIHLTQAAEETGVDALLLVAPYYNRPNQDGLYQHFKAVAESTKLPVVLYNVPARTGISLTPETTLRLAELDNVVGTKECASLEVVTQIVHGAPEGFHVYSGDDGAALPVLAVGGHGVISVASHIVGKEMKHMLNAYLSGDVKAAAKQHQQLHPIFKALFSTVPNPVGIKFALESRGVTVGGVRLPLVWVNEEEANALKQVF